MIRIFVIFFMTLIKVQAKELPLVEFPFSAKTPIFCDQGTESPPGNSHTYKNTLYALDLATEKKSPPGKIFSSIQGYIISFNQCQNHNTKCGEGFGNHIKILRSDGLLVMYAHLEKVLVKTGESVKPGQLIGIEGNTGWTGHNNRHLHFSVHKDWREQGIEYYQRYLGSLPDSVPFLLNACQPKHKTCNEQPIYAQQIKCKRVTGEDEPIRAL